MNKTKFGAIHYEINLDTKIENTRSRIFQGKSFSKLETIQHVCELEQTQVLQLLALAVLKEPYRGYLLSGSSSYVIDYEANILWYCACDKKNFNTLCF